MATQAATALRRRASPPPVAFPASPAAVSGSAEPSLPWELPAAAPSAPPEPAEPEEVAEPEEPAERFVEKIAVAVSVRATVGTVSRATARRGSGTGALLPDVGSADDSCCFDLSGDSPATDASSVRHTVRPTEP
ncbi:hypothetical protein [Streptomyces sp. NPDC006285]|uniref:hypothetical protein n=1 Tax=Streptomyces sp. NPDC006285 TaxID=3364742 RepID=UPI003676B98F